MRKICGYILLAAPTFLWAWAVWRWEGTFDFFNIALSAVLHECGHILAFSALGLDMPHISPVARGVRLVSPRQLSYREELIIATGGPLINFLIWVIGLLWRGRVTALSAFGDANLLTALCNLVPLADLDGERILRCLLAPHLSDRALFYVMRVVEWISLFIGLFLSLILYWYTGGGLYPAMLAMAYLLAYDASHGKKREKQR